MIVLTDKEQFIVNDILGKYVPDCRVLAFGSRVTGKVKPYSDLDLAVIGSDVLSSRTLGVLEAAFDESDLPFKVDVLDWNSLNTDFKNTISNSSQEIVYH